MTDKTEQLIDLFRKFRHSYNRFYLTGDPRSGAEALAAIAEIRKKGLQASKNIEEQIKKSKKQLNYEKLDQLLNIKPKK